MSITSNMCVQTGLETDLARRFPAQFLWGAATAFYQAEEAVREDGWVPGIWGDFAATGKVFQGYTGVVAADHYHRVEEDLAPPLFQAKSFSSSARLMCALPCSICAGER